LYTLISDQKPYAQAIREKLFALIHNYARLFTIYSQGKSAIPVATLQAIDCVRARRNHAWHAQHSKEKLRETLMFCGIELNSKSNAAGGDQP